MKNQIEKNGIVFSFIIVACVIGLFVYIIMNNKKYEQNLPEEVSSVNQNEVQDITTDPTTTTEKESLPPKNKMETNSKTLSNFTPVSKTANLQKIDVVVGTGVEVKAGATVSVHYTGAVAATGVIFQSSKDFGPTPVTFPLGQVIKGWTDGIPGMKIGGTRRLVIPAAQAYGSNPPPGSGIPANADLVFDVELISIQ